MKQKQIVSFESIITHITPVGWNVFTDLGFEPEEAARLLAETDAAISERLDIKESLMVEIPERTETKKR